MFEVVDPNEFLDNGLFSEDIFIQKVDAHHWGNYTDKKVLVRGCSTLIPPFAYMMITAKLVGQAKSVRYGNEHDHIVVWRRK
ncbi:MAG: DUF2480 family protein [bacterium]|nr:DUF2480 family protein [bacterium]